MTAVDRFWFALKSGGVFEFLEQTSGGRLLNQVFDDLVVGKVGPEGARAGLLRAHKARLDKFLHLWRTKFLPVFRALCWQERVDWGRESEKTFFRLLWCEFEPMTVYNADEEWLQLVPMPALEAAKRSLEHQIRTELAVRFRGRRTPEDANWEPPASDFLSA